MIMTTDSSQSIGMAFHITSVISVEISTEFHLAVTASGIDEAQVEERRVHL